MFIAVCIFFQKSKIVVENHLAFVVDIEVNWVVVINDRPVG